LSKYLNIQLDNPNNADWSISFIASDLLLRSRRHITIKIISHLKSLLSIIIRENVNRKNLVKFGFLSKLSFCLEKKNEWRHIIAIKNIYFIFAAEIALSINILILFSFIWIYLKKWVGRIVASCLFSVVSIRDGADFGLIAIIDLIIGF
jgi:hypothetical protein